MFCPRKQRNWATQIITKRGQGYLCESRKGERLKGIYIPHSSSKQPMQENPANSRMRGAFWFCL
jgi:hypothetical protein